MNSLGLDKPPAETRVVVAMSGGVDSSVCAAMLADEGYQVIGVTLQLYDHGEAVSRPGTCCAGRDIGDAVKVADAISIPHYVLDFEDRFREEVMDDFADTYLRGETPNPCIRCNQTVKFTDLLDKASELGADLMVTGHYARWRQGAGGPELHRGADAVRDQSYFLFATTRQQLARLRFPLGSLDKEGTRRLARRFNLAVAAKPDSQDICFVPQGAYASVVEALRPGACVAGDIVDTQGRVLGRHDGIINFTVGQRRGLSVAGGVPLYVVRLEPETATVVAGAKEELLKDRLTVNNVNWLGDGDLTADGIPLQVKLRSAMPAVPALVRDLGDGAAEVALDQPLAGVAPGQACVFYDAERLLGGGWIRRDGT